MKSTAGLLGRNSSLPSILDEPMKPFLASSDLCHILSQNHVSYPSCTYKNHCTASSSCSSSSVTSFYRGNKTPQAVQQNVMRKEEKFDSLLQFSHSHDLPGLSTTEVVSYPSCSWGRTFWIRNQVVLLVFKDVVWTVLVQQHKKRALC